MTAPKNRLILTPEQRTALEIVRKHGRLRNYPGADYYVAANKQRRDPREYVHRAIIEPLVRKGLLRRIGTDVVLTTVLAEPAEPEAAAS